MRAYGTLGLGFWLAACAATEPRTSDGASSASQAPSTDAGPPGAAPDFDAGDLANPSSSDAAVSAGPQPSCDQKLTLVVRDFTEQHPDFEHYTGAVQGIVAEKLGADHKPVYAPSGPTAATTGKAEFDQWYRDVDGVNMRVPTNIAFTEESPGVFVYDNEAFFPIDGQGFGNGPKSGTVIPILNIPIGSIPDHNFLFTTEAHTKFTYEGGEQFTFRGDDDLWVFINDTLAVDLGGTHTAEEKTIDLDAEAAHLGLSKGQTYPMDIFHAERHTVESHYRIETTIDLSCIQNVEVF
jgi:fibro-slime domain-containing protein